MWTKQIGFKQPRGASGRAMVKIQYQDGNVTAVIAVNGIDWTDPDIRSYKLVIK